jgi:hypothetical protein
MSLKRRLPMASARDAITLVHRINKDRAIQQRLSALKPRDWASFFALAAELGYDVNHEAFHHGCLSDEVIHFCPALSRFAGPLFSYKL